MLPKTTITFSVETVFLFLQVLSRYSYDDLSQTFSKVVQKHVPLKKKILRGNHAPFMNRELRKEIYKQSRLRNKFWKDPSKENELLF